MRDSKQDVIVFWFEETQPAQWFQKNPDFDASVHARFLDVYEQACAGKFSDWALDPDGALALCLVLDQFPRNMFRNHARAYATDAQALLVAKQAIHRGFDQLLLPMKRRFLYLPFEHSEKLSDQKRSVELFASMQKDDPLGYEYALRHYAIIEKYGRFPHRNAVLQRENTPEEAEYLSQPGSGF
ncbi:MAG: DUF924 domain-containing protein [Alphaproteobacteria bacterium]|nr:DUF924 domain-containing protein [Alphaproteobacteria bacterium]